MTFFTPDNHAELKTAVDAWINNRETAESVYGHISVWVTTNVDDMHRLFIGENSFNDDISSWDTSNVTTMREMFNGASDFNQDISSWNTINVTDTG